MIRSVDEATPSSSLDVRQRLVQALHLDLVGPGAEDDLANERLPGWIRPSNWYLTGFLVPSGSPPEERSDLDDDDDVELVPEAAGLAEESFEERKAAKKSFFPSSMGLSFLVAEAATSLDITVRWGDYVLVESEGDDGTSLKVWRRRDCEERIRLHMGRATAPIPTEIPNSDGLQLVLVERAIAAPELAGTIPQGTRSVSVFLVNHRPCDEEMKDRAYAFQAEITVESEVPFVPRPDLRGALAEDWDEDVADLHYADTPEYATGHAVAAEWTLDNGECRLLRTTWIPSAEVEKTRTASIEGVELSMDELGALSDGAAAEACLRPLVAAYRTWIDASRPRLAGLRKDRRETAETLLTRAALAAKRIEGGIRLLAEDPHALEAFRVANRAVARALKRRLKIETPEWRAFQLAFILLNLRGLSRPESPERGIVDLLFFPTGGGKTEAYLGLAAFTMVLRRLKNPGEGGREGAGVAVVMRYTLRLLTLDQLTRAAGLVCALELERAQSAERLGDWPFEIGLWVGKAATPNRMGEKGEKRSDSARAKVRRHKADPRSRPSPIPMENCPWCGEAFTADSFHLLPNADQPKDLRISCSNFDCDFSGDRTLPIVAIDDVIYRRLPAFLIATVDKFAALPWVGACGSLLGGAIRYDESGFYGALDPGKGRKLGVPLAPPDLVIQDEMHLISGPLGTMAGLYETVIDGLCRRSEHHPDFGPKIVASTATVKRAQDQIQALFARPLTEIFPPPGPDRRDSFFARTMPSSEVPARLYLGVAAQGRNPKVIMRRIWLALMGAAWRQYKDADGASKTSSNPADPYMTLLGYFNSLKELGGARRILEEEVQNTLRGYGARRRIGETTGLFQNRKRFREVVELTSRVSTDKVAEARRRLETSFHEKESVDCAIATNMISVGLDIPRLGLMVVFGQPKTHAEYIQATSRVGRDEKRPGLVVTLLNIHKPRDRSHYERFRHYHETFYRSVEVGSVTPFSARALDRGLAGALVGYVRHAFAELETPAGAERIAGARRDAETRLLEIFLDRVDQQPGMESRERKEKRQSVRSRIVDLLDAWVTVVDGYRAEGANVRYQKYEGGSGAPLLRDMLDQDFESEHHAKFRAPRSLRDVEPQVNLFLKDGYTTGMSGGTA